MIGLLVTLGNFPSRYLKCSFHFCIRSSWLVAFSSALEMLFLLLTSFTVCHAVQGCLSSTEFLILLIWPWMYSICSFWYVSICSLYAFLSFWALGSLYYVGIRLSCSFVRLFLTVNDSHGTLFSSLVGMYSADIYISPEERWICFLLLSYIYGYLYC